MAGQHTPSLFSRVISRIHRYMDYRFDLKYNIETSTNISISELQDKLDFTDYAIDELYSGTPTLLFKACHEPIMGPGKKNMTYIDIGCGKARIMIQGIETGFNRLIGVELVPSIADLGRKNIRKALTQMNKTANWDIVSQDVQSYAYPDTDLALYLYNPFDPPVFEKFLDNLINNLNANPRKMTLIYHHAYCADLLDACPVLERVKYSFWSKTMLKLFSNHSYGAWHYTPPASLTDNHGL